MKKKMLKPIAAVAVASFTIFGCASSNDRTDATAMEDTTISETQTMAGDDRTMSDGRMMENEARMTGTTIDIADLRLTNDMDYDEMFEDIENTEQYDVLALAQTSPNLSTFMELLRAADMERALQTEGPFTVFAPSNEAFAEMPAGELENLLKPENKNELIKMLQAHVLASRTTANEFTNAQRIGTTDGNYIMIDVNNMNAISIGGANIVKSDVEASNGVLHVVDAIVTPTATSPTGY